MKIEKLPSSSYRMRKMYKRKTYTVITDYNKPTQKEAIQLMADELDKVKRKQADMTFREAAEKYIESKRNLLSPSTIKGYKAYVSTFSDWFISKNVNDITQIDVQREINILAACRAPKTVRNYHGFITAVLNMFNPSLR